MPNATECKQMIVVPWSLLAMPPRFGLKFKISCMDRMFVTHNT